MAIFVGNCPLAYYLQLSTMSSNMAKRRKQIQPRLGVEKAFGQVMRQIRKKLDISQAELERRTGLDRTFISDLERGIQGPGIRSIFRLAKGLDTPAWDLIRFTAQSSFFTFPRGRDTA
jgi:DNA-binding XRE family transcriptional regulator